MMLPPNKVNFFQSLILQQQEDIIEIHLDWWKISLKVLKLYNMVPFYQLNLQNVNFSGLKCIFLLE